MWEPKARTKILAVAKIVHSDPRTRKDRGPGIDPRNDARLDVPAYQGAEFAQVIEAMTAPTQIDHPGAVHLGSEAECSLENGKWIAEQELCLRAAEFAAKQVPARL